MQCFDVTFEKSNISKNDKDYCNRLIKKYE